MLVAESVQEPGTSLEMPTKINARPSASSIEGPRQPMGYLLFHHGGLPPRESLVESKHLLAVVFS